MRELTKSERFWRLCAMQWLAGYAQGAMQGDKLQLENDVVLTEWEFYLRNIRAPDDELHTARQTFGVVLSELKLRGRDPWGHN